MHLTVKYDPEASIISEKLTFFCDSYNLSREDIEDLKKRKWLNFVETDTLPETIPCQVFVYVESFRKAKIVFYNANFLLPEEVYDEPFLNRNLIEWARGNGGFWLEFELPLKTGGKELVLDLELV